ncbi:MAG: hypothetical protein DMF74_17540 [Acidobacteria bacterium]|nr:MAG: hypothetical protein DMF74_17540 [Acidobacteriota bacterium]
MCSGSLKLQIEPIGTIVTAGDLVGRNEARRDTREQFEICILQFAIFNRGQNKNDSLLLRTKRIK